MAAETLERLIMFFPGCSEIRPHWNLLTDSSCHTERTSACYCALWHSLQSVLHTKIIALLRFDYYSFTLECKYHEGKPSQREEMNCECRKKRAMSQI